MAKQEDKWFEWPLFILGIVMILGSIFAPIAVLKFGATISLFSWELYTIILSIAGYIILYKFLKELGK